MADAEKKYKGASKEVYDLIRANGWDSWTPERYANMYIYAFLYHKVRGNPKQYGLTENSNLNQQIDEVILDKMDELIANYNIGSLGHHFKKDNFIRDIPNLRSNLRQFSVSAFGNKDGGIPSIAQVDQIMTAKMYECRTKFMNIKSSGDDNFQNLDPKDGSDSGAGGYYLRKYEDAKLRKKEKLAPLRRARWKQLAFGALTLAAGAATLGGLGVFLGIGGGALAGGLGASFSALGALGGTLGGLVSSVVGFFVSKTFLGKFIERRREKIKAKKEYKDFMRGEGKYALDKDGKPLGYKQLKEKAELARTAKLIVIGYGDFKGDFENDARFNYIMQNFSKDAGFEDLKNKYLSLKNAKSSTRILDAKDLLDNFIKSKGAAEFKTYFEKTEAKMKVNYFGEYQNYVMKKYPEFCKKRSQWGDWKEVVKEAIFNSDAADSEGIMGRVMGLLKEYNAYDDSFNTRTVREHIDAANELINDSFTSLEDLKVGLQELEARKGYFDEHQSTEDYIKIMDRLNRAVVQKVVNYADGPFTGSAKNDIDNAIKDPIIKKAIEASGIAGEIEELQGLSAFIEKESTLLNENLGVSIKDQLSFDQDGMISACLSLGAERSDIESICIDIANMTHQNQSAAIKTNIDFLADDGVKNYLSFILNRKTIQSKVDTTLVDASVKNDIENLVDPDDPDNVKLIEIIKTKINSIADPVKKAYAQQVLDEQIKALNFKIKLENTLGALENLKQLKDGNIIEYYKTISEIQEYSDGFDGGKLLSFQKDLQRLKPEILSKYMVMKLKEKVKTIYLNHVKSQEKTFAADAGKIREFMGKIQQSKILTDSQKNLVAEELGKSLEGALDNELNYLIDHLFEYDPVTSSKILDDYVKQNYSGKVMGFAEFFNSNTPESQRIKSKIDRIKNALSAIGILRVNAKAVAGRSGKEYLGPKSDDTRYFVKVFFEGSEDRMLNKSTDDLYKITKVMEDLYGQTVILENDKVSDGLEKLLREIKTKGLDEIKSSGLNDREKLAALLMVKRRVIGLFKTQMCKIIEGKEDTEVPTFLKTGAGKTWFDQVKSDFNSLICNDLDKEIARLTSIVNLDGLDIQGTNKEIGSIDASNYLNILQTIDSGFESSAFNKGPERSM